MAMATATSNCFSNKVLFDINEEAQVQTELNNKVVRQSNVQYFLDQILNIQGYTLDRVAKILNISTTTIKRIKCGTTEHPRLQVSEKIIRLYCSLNCQ